MAKIKIEPMKRKDVKLSVRDEWIPESWRYNGAGAHKNKKKQIPRKAKYKKSWDQGLTNSPTNAIIIM